MTSTTQQSALSRLIRSGRVQFGLALMSLVVFIAVFGPLFAINGPTDLVGIPFDPPQDTLPLELTFWVGMFWRASSMVAGTLSGCPSAPLVSDWRLGRHLD